MEGRDLLGLASFTPALGSGRDLQPWAPGSGARATALVELFVRTCVFLSPEVLPAVFPRGCPSPSDRHTDKSASQVLGRGVVEAVP